MSPKRARMEIVKKNRFGGFGLKAEGSRITPCGAISHSIGKVPKGARVLLLQRKDVGTPIYVYTRQYKYGRNYKQWNNYKEKPVHRFGYPERKYVVLDFRTTSFNPTNAKHVAEMHEIAIGLGLERITNQGKLVIKTSSGQGIEKNLFHEVVEKSRIAEERKATKK